MTSSPAPPDTLTSDERAIYDALAAHDGAVATKTDLLATLPVLRTTRRLDAAADSLRSKLRAAEHPLVPCNIWGVGYRLGPAAVPTP